MFTNFDHMVYAFDHMVYARDSFMQYQTVSSQTLSSFFHQEKNTASNFFHVTFFLLNCYVFSILTKLGQIFVFFFFVTQTLGSNEVTTLPSTGKLRNGNIKEML